MKHVEVYNLPAGTGKTYKIVTDIKAQVLQGKGKILYITYTNRAKDEAKQRIDSEYDSSLQIETVHTFIHQFLKDYLKEEKIVETIQKELKVDPDRNGFYLYNRKNYSSKGEIGHDDLIKVFTCLISHDNFGGIKQHLLRLFDFVYIDEFQDLDLNFILSMISLYSSDINKYGSKLYIYGDTIQQIYDPANSYKEEKERYTRDKEMLDKILNYEKEEIQLYNYRSSQIIIDLLNTFRGDKSKKQIVTEESAKYQKLKPSYNFKQKIEFEKFSDYIVLFGTNKQKYDFLKCNKLFETYQKVYGYQSEINFDSDILLAYQKELYEHNPDPLMNFIEHVFYLKELIENQAPIGELLPVIKKLPFDNKFEESIRKQELRQIEAFKQYVNSENFLDENIHNLISQTKKIFVTRKFQEEKIWNEKWTEDCKQKAKEDIFLLEFDLLFKERDKPKVSTLHGSKGESYNKVFIDLSVKTKKPNGAKQFTSNAYKIYRALGVMDAIYKKETEFTIYKFEQLYQSVIEEETSELKYLNNYYKRLTLSENRKEGYCLACEMKRDLYTLNLLYVSFSRAREHIHILFSNDYKKFKDLMLSFDFEEKELNFEGRN